jgi:hypothetical protein
VDVTVDDQKTTYYGSATLGFAYIWSERLELTLDLGGRMSRDELIIQRSYPFNSTMATQEEFSDSQGFVGTLNAIYKTWTGRISMAVSHDLVPASGREGTVERTVLRFAGSRRFQDKWHCSGSISGFWNRTGESEAIDETEEQTLQLHADLKYAFNPWLSLGAHWTTTWIDDLEGDTDRRQTTLSLRLLWDLPIKE